jgi:hypothetical protein
MGASPSASTPATLAAVTPFMAPAPLIILRFG